MRLTTLCLLLLTLAAPLVAQEKRPVAIAPQPVTIARPLTVSDQAALVTEFEVNGLKVLVKRREGSQTVVAGLFIKGGTRNITAANAGIEDLMLDASSEATTSFPRERLRTELHGLAGLAGLLALGHASSLPSTRARSRASWGRRGRLRLRRRASDPHDSGCEHSLGRFPRHRR